MDPAIRTRTEQRFTTLIELERDVRRAETLNALGTILVNRTRELIPFRRAALLLPRRRRLRIAFLSDVPNVERTSPFVQELERLASRVRTGSGGDTIHELQETFQEAASSHTIWVPLASSQQGEQGALVLFTEEALTPHDRVLLEHLAEAFAHALQVFFPRSAFRKGLSLLTSRPAATAVGLLILGLLYGVQVPLNALAPAEIVPQQPYRVTSPLEGVVQEIRVRSNQEVAPGDLLALLDDTELRNRVDTAQKALEVAEEQYARARRGAFIDAESKAVLAELSALVRQRQAEVRHARTWLDRTRLTADRPGVAITPPPEEWEGRPVAVGEAIMEIADPRKVEVRVFLPVQDAVLLRKQNRVTLFLDSDPLDPLRGRVERSAYMPEVTPLGHYAYRVTVALEGGEAPPRIGLRGTAKVYGRDVSLGFYLFRRPVTALRQGLGL